MGKVLAGRSLKFKIITITWCVLVMGGVLFGIVWVIAAVISEATRGRDIYEGLVGRWVSTLDHRIYIFNEDGTGLRGDEPFNWGVSGDELIIRRYSQNVGRYEWSTERWALTFYSDRRVNISTLHGQPTRGRVVGVTLGDTRYYRRLPAWRQLMQRRYLNEIGIIDPVLVGTWDMVDTPHDGWRMVFYETGFGNSGFDDASRFQVLFAWGVTDGNQMRLVHLDRDLVYKPIHWYMTITGDTLLFIHSQDADRQLLYTRR